MDYSLELFSIFIKLDSHYQLIIPIEDPHEGAIGEWIEDKLVGFTQTFFEMCFQDQYQKKHLENNPIMNMRFPRTLAFGKKEDGGRMYHFSAKGSLQEFETDSSEYVTTS